MNILQNPLFNMKEILPTLQKMHWKEIKKLNGLAIKHANRGKIAEIILLKVKAEEVNFAQVGLVAF